MHVDLDVAARRRILRASVVLVMASGLAAGLVPISASAQSIMDRLKAAAQQKAGAQPTAAAKPNQPAAAKSAAAASGPAAGDSGPFTAPAGTVITPLVIGPS